MATSATEICNMALGKLGANRITDLSDTTETKEEAIQCRLHYEPTRDALLRSHQWRFASARATLAEDTESPDFEWATQFKLPNDFIAMRSIYENRFSSENLRSYAVEGKLLLTNESTMEIRYIKKVTDVSQFDPLFVKLLATLLADEMIGPLTGGDPRIQEKISRQIETLMPAVRAMDAQETNTEGQYDLETWNDSRYA